MFFCCCCFCFGTKGKREFHQKKLLSQKILSMWKIHQNLAEMSHTHMSRLQQCVSWVIIFFSKFIHIGHIPDRELYINLFSNKVPLLYPLKTLENQRFSDVFRGYSSGTLVENGLKWNACKLSLFNLTHFQPIFHFYTPWKHQKPSDFLMFSGGIEVEYWLTMVKLLC